MKKLAFVLAAAVPAVAFSTAARADCGAFTIASMIGGVFGGPAASRVKTWVLMVVFAVLLALVAVFVGVSLALGIAT